MYFELEWLQVAVCPALSKTHSIGHYKMIFISITGGAAAATQPHKNWLPGQLCFWSLAAAAAWRGRAAAAQSVNKICIHLFDVRFQWERSRDSQRSTGHCNISSVTLHCTVSTKFRGYLQNVRWKYLFKRPLTIREGTGRHFQQGEGTLWKFTQLTSGNRLCSISAPPSRSTMPRSPAPPRTPRTWGSSRATSSPRRRGSTCTGRVDITPGVTGSGRGLTCRGCGSCSQRTAGARTLRQTASRWSRSAESHCHHHCHYYHHYRHYEQF